MGLTVLYAIGFLLFAMLILIVVIPEVQRVRNSQFWDFAIARTLDKKFLISFISVTIVAGLLMFLQPVPTVFNTTSNFPSGKDLVGFIASMISGLLNLAALGILILWINGYVARGRGGLFRDLILSGNRVQDYVKPFFWLLLPIALLSKIPEMLSSVRMGLHMGLDLTLLTIPLTFVYAFGINSFIFGVCIRRYGIISVVAAGFAVLLLTTALIAFLVFLEITYLGVENPIAMINSPDVAQWVKLFSANYLIAGSILAWLIYWRFSSYSGRAWLEKGDLK